MKTRSLQLVGAAALSTLTTLIALAHAQDLCDSMQIGNETQFTLSLVERHEEPKMFTLEISEPDVCSDSEAVGLKVTACDREQAPHVYLVDTAHGMVVRKGSVATPAYVYITVFCASASDEALDASVESPIVSNPFLDEASLQSSLIPSPPLLLPSTVISVSTPTTFSTQPRTTSTPNSLALPDVEPPSILISSMKEYLPPVQLESRYSSLAQSTPTILSSKFKDLWQEHPAPTLGQLKSESYPGSISSRAQKNQSSSLLDKAKHQPSFLNSLSKWPQNPSSLPDMSSSSLAKRFTAMRPKHLPKWLANQSPAWLKRSTRRPSSLWLKLRSLPDGKTRQWMTRSRDHPSIPNPDYGDPWSPYDYNLLSLHWSDEPLDSIPWYKDGAGPWPIHYPEAYNLHERPPSSLLHERPSPSAVKHMSKKQTRYVPPIREEDPALLAEWKRDLDRTPRSLLLKLLILLQEQDHPALLQRKCASVHSVEDAEPWWSNQPYNENLGEGFPWQPDYSTDYSGADSNSYLPEHYTDDKEQSSHYVPGYIEEPEHPWGSLGSLGHPENAHHSPDVPHFPLHPAAEPPQVLSHPPLESFLYDSPTPVTERPPLTSTERHSLSWVKSSNSVTPMHLKQPSSKAELSEYHPLAAPWNLLSQLLLSHPTF